MPARTAAAVKPVDCDFAAEMVILFKVPSEADQETKNSNAEHNQSDRSLIVRRNFHWLRQSNIAGPQNSSALFAQRALS